MSGRKVWVMNKWMDAQTGVGTDQHTHRQNGRRARPKSYSQIGDCLVQLQSSGFVAGLFHTRFQASPTFKVHSSISVEVHISDNFLYVSVSHLMT